MTEPDDRALEQYLKGDSALSRRYREASRETAPPGLDAAILAQARAATRAPARRRGGWGTGLALAASLMLAVNLGWNVWRAEPVPDEAADSVAQAPAPPPETGAEPAPAPAPVLDDAPFAKRETRARLEESRKAKQASSDAQAQHRVEEEAQAAAELERRQAFARQQDTLGAAGSTASAPMMAAPAAAPAPPAPLTEPQKIDRLIAYVGSLQGAVFIRNGSEHTPQEAVEHMQLKRRKAGDRVKTADDFIRLCASHSYLTKEAYLIRFADGRTRTAEDVLREELARIGSGQ